MRKLLALVVAIAVLGLGLWIFLDKRSEAPAVVQTSVEAEKPAAPETQLSAPAPTTEKHARTAPVEPAAPPTASADVAAPSDGLAQIKGRFLLPGGGPASGVKLDVSGWVGNQDREMKYGRPKSWEDLSATSDADGRFSIRFDPPRAFQFTLVAKLDGYCEENWRWGEIPPATVKDVGDIELKLGGVIVGRVLDSAGQVLTKDWMVYADGPRSTASEGRDGTRGRQAVDPVNGEFRIEGMPPGAVQLKAYSRMANWVEGPTVEVRAGETTRADIRYAGPDNSRRITVSLFARPFFIFEHDAEEILLRGPGIDPRRAVKVEHSSQSFSFDDVPPGRYTIEIRDPKFEPWSRDDVEPGSSVKASLKGAARIQLTVVDAASNQLVSSYSVKVRFDKSNWRPNTFEILKLGSAPPAGGLFDGMIPVDQTVLVGADGYAECSLAVEGLGAGEIRSLVARMSEGSIVSGTVVEDGSREPKADVQVVLGPPPDPNARSFNMSDAAASSREARTDPQGRFTFSGVPAGTYALTATLTPWMSGSLDPVLVDGTQRKEGLEIVLPAGAFVGGKVLAPEGARIDDLALTFDPVQAEDEPTRGQNAAQWAGRDKRRIALSQDGSYAAGPLPPGRMKASLLFPKTMVPSGFSSSSGVQAPKLDLGEVVLTPGPRSARDFDLRSSFPAYVRVRVTVNGVVAPSLVVIAHAEDRNRNAVAAVSLDADGRGRLGPLQPKDHRLIVRTIDTSWFYIAPATFTAQCCAEPELVIDVPLVEGTLKVVDDTSGAALASKELLIHLDVEDYLVGGGAKTDESGAMHLRLPAGRYVLDAGFDFKARKMGPKVPFDWTDAGPVPAVLKMPRGE